MSDLPDDLHLMQATARLACESFSEGRLPPDNALEGVKAVDVWEYGTDAAMLFAVDAKADLLGTGEPALYDVYLEREAEVWRASVGGALAFDNLEDAVAEFSPGLHPITHTSCGTVRLTWAFATPEVAFVRLLTGAERHDRKPGRGGFVILGMTPERPITHAYAIDGAGRQLASVPILL